MRAAETHRAELAGVGVHPVSVHAEHVRDGRGVRHASGAGRASAAREQLGDARRDQLYVLRVPSVGALGSIGRRASERLARALHALMS